MICLKKVSKKFDKYIKDKKGRKYKKLKASVLKNTIWSSVLKNVRSYWETTKKS